jgi:hypothetical protein
MKMQVESCCEAHDKAYHHSGISRQDADLALYQCVRDGGRQKFAYAMWLFVRTFGWMFYRS